MKGFKKLALVAAISAAPFAQAELTSIDDSVLSDMTGQAGITIELDTALTIASITYTDTDGYEGGSGSLDITGIAFGGSTVAGGTQTSADARLNDLKIDIDVDSVDGLVIHLGGTDSKNSLLGANPVDFGLSIDSVGSNALAGDLASNIKIGGNLGPIDIIIDGDGTVGNDLIDVKAYFEVTTGSLDVPVIGLGIQNLTIGQDSSPIVSGAYRADIVTALAGAGATSGSTDAQLVGLINGAYGAGVADATGKGAVLANAANITLAGTTAFDNFVADGAEVNAGGDPVDVNDKSAEDLRTDAEAVATTGFYNAGAGSVDVAVTNAAVNPGNATNMAFVSLTVGTGSANYTDLVDGDVTIGNALIVNLTSFNVDIAMDLTIGEKSTVAAPVAVAQSLGSIAIQDLDMSGTVLKIYGH
jgi:hypothetical protein